MNFKSSLIYTSYKYFREIYAFHQCLAAVSSSSYDNFSRLILARRKDSIWTSLYHESGGWRTRSWVTSFSCLKGPKMPAPLFFPASSQVPSQTVLPFLLELSFDCLTLYFCYRLLVQLYCDQKFVSLYHDISCTELASILLFLTVVISGKKLLFPFSSKTTFTATRG